jgi:hypothetical protein
VLAVNGAYLVSLCAHLAGEPEDGVRDSLSAGSHSGNDAQCMTSASRLHAFWLQLPPEGVNKRKLFNSYDGSDESSHYVSRTLYLSNLPASCSWDWGRLAPSLCACAQVVYPQLQVRGLLRTHVQLRSRRSRRGFGGKQDTESGSALVTSSNRKINFGWT